MKKIKIGITGNIGSGKSTVAEYYRNKGYTVLDADTIAKDMYNKPNVKVRVIQSFGEESYIDSQPNLKYIANAVFDNEENLQILNSIIHPPMIREINRLMEKELEDSEAVFTEAALIYEAGMEDMFDFVILITADDEIKISRTMERSGLSRDEVELRLSKQISEDIKKTYADFIIENNSVKESLYQKCDFIFNLLYQIS